MIVVARVLDLINKFETWVVPRMQTPSSQFRDDGVFLLKAGLDIDYADKHRVKRLK